MAEKKLITYDYAGAMAQVIGDENGITEKDIKSLSKKAKEIHEDLTNKRKNGDIGFFDLPYDEMIVKAISAISMEFRRNFENFVIVGIGGSSLGTACLHNALNPDYHNFLPDSKRKSKPRIFFLDNPDPCDVKSLLDALDLRTTGFNIISKSGSTAETMAIFMHIYNVVQRRFSKTALSKHFIVTTDPEEGLLREVAVQDKLKTLPIPQNVGGRFSVFSPVGLLPAAVSGINIKKLLEGAVWMDKKCSEADLMKNPAYLNAAIHYLMHTKKKKNISVMMPYTSSLKTFSDWYAQLWAESLGKKLDLNGKEVFTGQTPVKALGAVDQHSQMQLYREGPVDKIITFVGLKQFSNDCKATKVFHNLEPLMHLTDKDLGELLNSELEATEFAIANAGRPSVRITLNELSPESVGALLYMFEVQTAFAGGLYNIDPFNQPGVEEGKKATHAIMGRKKKEDKQKMKEIKAYFKEKKKFKCL